MKNSNKKSSAAPQKGAKTGKAKGLKMKDLDVSGAGGKVKGGYAFRTGGSGSVVNTDGYRMFGQPMN